jgi:hypothetical protein
MSDHEATRRETIKKAVYAAPSLSTLVASPPWRPQALHPILGQVPVRRTRIMPCKLVGAETRLLIAPRRQSC